MYAIRSYYELDILSDDRVVEVEEALHIAVRDGEELLCLPVYGAVDIEAGLVEVGEDRLHGPVVLEVEAHSRGVDDDLDLLVELFGGGISYNFV